MEYFEASDRLKAAELYYACIERLTVISDEQSLYKNDLIFTCEVFRDGQAQLVSGDPYLAATMDISPIAESWLADSFQEVFVGASGAVYIERSDGRLFRNNKEIDRDDQTQKLNAAALNFGTSFLIEFSEIDLPRRPPESMLYDYRAFYAMGIDEGGYLSAHIFIKAVDPNRGPLQSNSKISLASCMRA